MKALIVGEVSERILPMITLLESEGVETVYDSGKDIRDFSGFKFDYVIVDELVSENSLLRNLSPSAEKEMLAFLYTLNFDKTNSNIKENVEI